MNLNAYDNVEQKFEEGTWVNPKFKRLYSTELAKRIYFVFLKRYDIENNIYNYYIALLDNIPEDREFHAVIHTKHGISKLELKTIWDNCPLKNIKVKSNISIKHIEHTDDGDIYYLDI